MVKIKSAQTNIILYLFWASRTKNQLFQNKILGKCTELRATDEITIFDEGSILVKSLN